MKQELRNHQLDNFISSSSILEKCKRMIKYNNFIMIYTFKIIKISFYLGVALCNRYNHTIPDFLIKLEAFVMNANLTDISIDTIGQFDQSLYKESRIKSTDSNIAKVWEKYFKYNLLYIII